MACTITNRATELVRELKRSDWIPKYNVQITEWADGKEEGINAVLDEMDDTMEKIIDIYVGMEEVAGEMPESAEGQVDEFDFWNGCPDGVEKKNKSSADIIQFSTFIIVLSITINDVCLPICSYFKFPITHRKHRLNKIRDYRWEKGSLLSDNAQSLLSKGEIQFFQKYDDLLSSYMQRSGFDLTSVCIVFMVYL